MADRLGSDAMRRYARQTIYPRIGMAGQARLQSSCVAVVGLGATGGAVAAMLVRSGVGRLRLIDRDYVELTNLQRQPLFEERDVAEASPKAIAAAARLRRINHLVEVEAVVADLSSANAARLLAGLDLIVDGTDNFATRFLINDFAISAGVAWVYCGVVGAHGVIMAIEAAGQPCLRCLHRDVPPPGSAETCDTAGVLVPAVSVVAGLAGMRALQRLLGDTAGAGMMLHVDAWDGAVHSFVVPAAKDCAACAKRSFEFLTARSEPSSVMCGRDSIQVRGRGRLDLDVVTTRLSGVGQILARNAYLVRARVDHYDLTVFGDGRAIVSGTQDAGQARSVYDRYVGS
jgi:adenylyltransferase/sulfurtransferase